MDFLLERKTSRDEDVRGEYFRDLTAIIHSMSFRRLKNKTQVFFSPENDHICTRIEHSLHVASISTVICKNLNVKKDLNTELAQAIAYGHDLGHAPFGHAGEIMIQNLIDTNSENNSKKFYHEINSLRVVDKLEKNGEGLNLTYAVRDGIVNHCGENFEQYISPRNIKEKIILGNIKEKNNYPITLEGCIVRVSDKISYLGRDIEDAIKAGFIKDKDIPEEIVKNLGEKNGEIIDTFVKDVIENSNENEIGFSDKISELMNLLKNFNNENIYKHKEINTYKKKASKVIETIFYYLKEIFEKNEWDLEKYDDDSIPLNKRFKNYLYKMKDFYLKEKTGVIQIIVDYISGMTDAYALKCAEEIIFPRPISFDKL